MRSNWTPPKKKEVRVLDRREFMQQYVLTRARALPQKVNAVGIAEAAGECWDKIEAICAKGEK